METVTVLPVLSALLEVVGCFLIINKLTGQNQFFERHETVIVDCLLGISFLVQFQSGHPAHISTLPSLLFHLHV